MANDKAKPGEPAERNEGEAPPRDPRRESESAQPPADRVIGPNPEYSRNDYNGPDRGVPDEPAPPNVQKARDAKRKRAP